jgi:hypothetical protein
MTICDEATKTLPQLKALLATAVNVQSSRPSHFYAEGVHTITDHYRVGSTHGAIVYRFDSTDTKIQQVFWYADEGQLIRTLQRFYEAVDGGRPTIDQLTSTSGSRPAIVTSDYLAVFGPGNAQVGGNTHIDGTHSDMMDLVHFKQWIKDGTPRCSGTCSVAMERVFVRQGNTVINHYTVPGATSTDPGVHAVAVHTFNPSGQLAESYWYTQHGESRCTVSSHQTKVVDLTTSIDHYYASNMMNGPNLEQFMHSTYQATFGPGCVLFGRAQRCGSAPITLTLPELNAFLNGTGPLHAAPPCPEDLVRNLTLRTASLASIPNCTRIWTQHNALASCLSGTHTTNNLCVDNSLVAEANSVVDTYRLACPQGNRLHCTTDQFVPHGVIVHEFDGSKIAQSYWCTSSVLRFVSCSVLLLRLIQCLHVRTSGVF